MLRFDENKKNSWLTSPLYQPSGVVSARKDFPVVHKLKYLILTRLISPMESYMFDWKIHSGSGFIFQKILQDRFLTQDKFLISIASKYGKVGHPKEHQKIQRKNKTCKHKNSSRRGRKLRERKAYVNTVYTCRSKKNLKAFNKTPIVPPFIPIIYLRFGISSVSL